MWQRWAAVATCLASRSATASVDSLPPARLGNSGSGGEAWRSLSQSRSSLAVGRVSGMLRCFRPLPRQCTFGAGRRQLAWALADRPELLTGAGAEARVPSVLRLRACQVFCVWGAPC